MYIFINFIYSKYIFCVLMTFNKKGYYDLILQGLYLEQTYRTLEYRGKFIKIIYFKKYCILTKCLLETFFSLGIFKQVSKKNISKVTMYMYIL